MCDLNRKFLYFWQAKTFFWAKGQRLSAYQFCWNAIKSAEIVIFWSFRFIRLYTLLLGSILNPVWEILPHNFMNGVTFLLNSKSSFRLISENIRNFEVWLNIQMIMMKITFKCSGNWSKMARPKRLLPGSPMRPMKTVSSTTSNTL